MCSRRLNSRRLTLSLLRFLFSSLFFAMVYILSLACRVYCTCSYSGSPPSPGSRNDSRTAWTNASICEKRKQRSTKGMPNAQICEATTWSADGVSLKQRRGRLSSKHQREDNTNGYGKVARSWLWAPGRRTCKLQEYGRTSTSHSRRAAMLARLQIRVHGATCYSVSLEHVQ